jgi:nucleoside-diphosphate-sugar epimerase
VIPTLMTALRDRVPFRIARKDSGRDFIHVYDVVSAIVAATRVSQADGRILNLASGSMTSIDDLITVAEDVTGMTVVVSEDPHPGGGADRSVWCGDITDTIVTLGWRPTVDLHRGLHMFWEQM